jgi:hypothetical protein
MGCGVGDPPNANKLKKKKKRIPSPHVTEGQLVAGFNPPMSMKVSS